MAEKCEVIYGIRKCSCNSLEFENSSVQVASFAKDDNYNKRLLLNSSQFETSESIAFQKIDNWCSDAYCLSHAGEFAAFLRSWFRERNNVCPGCGALLFPEDANFIYSNPYIIEESCRICCNKFKTFYDLQNVVDKNRDRGFLRALSKQGINALYPSPTTCKSSFISTLKMCTCYTEPYLIIGLEESKSLNEHKYIKR